MKILCNVSTHKRTNERAKIMSFAKNLSSKISEYTNFSMYGVSLHIPYQLGAKKTPKEISNVLAASFSSGASQADMQARLNRPNSAGKRDLGIDCSGFAYYVLNEASGGAVKNLFNVPYAYGVSAANLTSTKYGNKISRAMDITAGCLINSDNGGHVLLIYSVTKGSDGLVNRIDYAHSNGSKGPHKGYITIGDPGADLSSSRQTWHDPAYTDTQAKKYYTYTMRLNCLPSA